MTVTRNKVVFNEDSDVPSSNFTIFSAPITPDGETWQIQRILFADKNMGDNISGGFIVDYGSGVTRDVVAQAFLTGNTLDLPMQETVTGDGVKRLRIIRENNSLTPKKMIAMVIAIKRL